MPTVPENRAAKVPTDRLRSATGRRGRWLIAGIALVFLAFPAIAERRVEIYEVKFRIAEELLPLARTVMDGPESVALDRGTNSLVLIGAPGDVAKALELLSSLDHAPRTIALHYATLDLRQLDAWGLDVRWSIEAGDFRIGNVRAPIDSGSSLDVGVRSVLQELADSFTGTLRVSDGARTRIETGTSVPYELHSRRGPSTVYVDATTGFETHARILGDGSIQVDLSGFARRLLGTRGSIASTQTSTLVTLKPGETRVIGGIEGAHSERRADSLRGVRETNRVEDRVVLLRAEVEATAPASTR